jgi:FeS assembly SUF system protein
MTEEPKVSDFIEDKPSLPEACAETVAAVKGVAPAQTSALGEEEIERMTNDLIAAIKTVYDPEIPVDIFELGLIYKIDVDDDRAVAIEMTLTAPGCPVAGEMPIWVQNAALTVAGVSDVKVDLVFDPPWDMSRMSEEAQVALNMF